MGEDSERNRPTFDERAAAAVPVIPFFGGAAGNSSGQSVSTLAAMGGTLLFLFCVMLPAMVPVILGVRAYRRTGDRSHAIGIAIYFGAVGMAATAWVMLLIWSVFGVLIQAIVDETNGHLNAYAISRRLLFEPFVATIYCWMMGGMMQLFILPCFLAWRWLHAGSFHSLVRHLPRQSTDDN
jgi:hypothetical protein